MVLSSLDFWWGQRGKMSFLTLKPTDLSAVLCAGCVIKEFKAKAKWLQNVFVLFCW